MTAVNFYDTSIHTNPPPINLPVAGSVISREKSPYLSNPQSKLLLQDLGNQNTLGEQPMRHPYFDITLLEKVLLYQPFRAKYGEKTSKWNSICKELQKDFKTKKSICMRSTRLRFNNLMRDFEERLQNNDGLKKFVQSKSTSPVSAKHITQKDVLLARITRIPKRLSKRTIRSQKRALQSQLNQPINALEAPKNNGSDSKIECVTENEQDSDSIETNLGVSLTAESSSEYIDSTDEYSNLKSPKSDTSPSNYSDTNQSPDNMKSEFYQNIEEVFNLNDNESENKYPFDEHFYPPELLNENTKYYNDLLSFDHYSPFELDRDRMRWRWEYLEIMKRELNQRQFYREKKLTILKDLAFSIQSSARSF